MNRLLSHCEDFAERELRILAHAFFLQEKRLELVCL
jgi:hypothetical protein